MRPEPTNAHAALSRLFSVAPMIDWTDRHCRFFLRQLSRHT
ncbi:tRNA dihydrouridine(20/20a) synthase DusA, partial [Pseudomonas aeruginosa]|nr:tRNA dihydrouridine(20/20a) synthase DusA [Pseudomonas aeruginosa]